MSHRTNLVVQTLSHLLVVFCIESLLQSIYVFFFHSPKWHIEFTKLAELMGTKGKKFFKNVKAWWTSMLNLLLNVLSEYKPLLTKMVRYQKEVAQTNFDLLFDIFMFVGVTCLLAWNSAHSHKIFTTKIMCWCVIMWQPLWCAKANFMAFTMTPIHATVQMHSRTSKIFWTTNMTLCHWGGLLLSLTWIFLELNIWHFNVQNTHFMLLIWIISMEDLGMSLGIFITTLSMYAPFL